MLAEILGRDRSLFADDIDDNRAALDEMIRGSRVMIVGAAGSIGRAFTLEIVKWRPKALWLVDINENGLVEIVRLLRSSGLANDTEVRTFSVDFGSAAFHKLAETSGPFDAVMNFSAIKHVRAERDVFSLTRLIDVNVRALDDYLRIAEACGHKRVFSVSTDKVVNPANLMGASKYLMEAALFGAGAGIPVSSARFANVAFSDGSLLAGMLNRIAAGQPIGAPNDVRRYFISAQEASELCLLAAYLCQSGDVFFPKLTPDEDLKSFTDIAEIILRHHGYGILPCASDAEAIRKASEARNGAWPCVFAPSDTSGEKDFEEFFGGDDDLDLDRFRQIGVTRHPSDTPRIIPEFLSGIDSVLAKPTWSKADIVAQFRRAVPSLAHIETNRSLDEKL